MALRHTVSILPFLLSSFSSQVAADDPVNYNITGYDVAPDWSKDAIPPFPNITDENGKEIDAANVRGTRLFGFQGCDSPAADIIKATYNDFYKLAHLKGLYENLDWEGQPAKEMWGAPSKIPDERREEIRQIYDAAKEIWYSNWQRPPWSPPWPGRDLWIKVTCSGGDDSGDPNDRCGDKANQPQNPVCPPPKKGKDPMPGKKKDMEAYSSPTENWSRITFCKKFFNDLKSLDEVTKNVKNQRPEVQDHLDQWNNRARCFFHEITHLNYFMNAPEKSPFIDDALITYKSKEGTVEEGAYGPYNVKVLRNFRGDAWYAGQNADTFAWYAMAMWAKKEIGRYPHLPAAGSKKPTKAPRRGDGTPFTQPNSESEDEDLGDEEIDYEPDDGFTIPGCGDKEDIEDKNPPEKLEMDCSDDASKIPSNVFSSENNTVHGVFCGATVSNRRALHWTADASGNLEGSPPQVAKLLAGLTSMVISKILDVTKFKGYKFKLDWEPKKEFNPADCFISCEDAFKTFSKTPECGQKGDGKDLMAKSGKIEAGCGSFGYTIEEPKEEEPPQSTETPKPDPPKKSKALSIVFQNYIDEISNTNSWLFFETGIDESKLCERDKNAALKEDTDGGPGRYKDPGWPGGTFEFKIHDKDCTYKNDGSNPGALSCNGVDTPIECKEDKQNDGKDKECELGLWAVRQHAAVVCEW